MSAGNFGGRPRKPDALKAIEGNRGHRTRAELLRERETAITSSRGCPPMPAALEDRPEDEDATRIILASAREHWEYLCDVLSKDNLLGQADQGVLTSACLAFAAMAEAGRSGAMKTYLAAAAEYRSLADRMGMNEAARARLPKKPESNVDPLEATLCA